MDIEGAITETIFVLLAISGLIAVLEVVGLLPQWASRWINRNRSTATIEILKEMGLSLKAERNFHLFRQISQYIKSKKSDSEAIEIIKKYTIEAAVRVGDVDSVLSKNFIDIMSSQVSVETSRKIARILVSEWREIITRNFDGVEPVHYIICPKSSSPIIAYEVSQLLNIPLILHNPKEKFSSDPLLFCALFDGEPPKAEKSVGLLVDDSTTGGGKIIKLSEDLQRFGCTFNNALVLFEPTLKNARQKLENKNIILHSVLRIGTDGKPERKK